LKANLAVLVLLVVAAFSTSAQQTTRMAASQSTAEADVQFIQNLIAEYASAADHADAALASQIWSHSPDASFIYPEGHAHGVAEITDDVYRHAMGDTFSQRKLTIHSPSIHVYGDTAWSEFYWDFHANFRSNGAPFESKGRETQIYQKQEGHWFIIHVHYSGMPAAALGLKRR
jgi:ketosteroid isomerase-like protein